jgi:hypothetical protein
MPVGHVGETDRCPMKIVNAVHDAGQTGHDPDN